MRSFPLILSLFVIFLITKYLPAQSPSKEILHFGYLVDNSAENIEIGRERIFEGSGLFGFMNGGAELFLEYGFQQLLEQRITFHGIPFVAEYYFMDTPIHAYGIYSVHAFKCRRADDHFSFECLTPGLLQLCHNHLYLSIKCLDRSVDAQPMLDSLATLIANINPFTEGEKTGIGNTFLPPYSGTLFYVCGDLGLSTAFIEWAKYFAPYKHYTMWLRIDPETKKMTAQVTFASIADMESFCTLNEKHLNYTVIPPSTLKVCPLM
jgi:hypothetical protein